MVKAHRKIIEEYSALKEKLFVHEISFVSLIFVFTLLLRLTFFIFSDNFEPDGALRIMIALNWLKTPHLIIAGMWGPLHTYLIAFSIVVWNDPILSPQLVSLILGSLTVFPFFFLLKLLFNRNIALFSTLIFSVYTLQIRYSVLSLSEVPFTFFLFLSLCFFFKFKRDENKKYCFLAFACISLNLACMLRYEGWIFIPLLTLFLLKEKKTHLLFFFVISMIFPAFWMIGNYYINADPLYSVHFAHTYQVVIAGYNEGYTLYTALYRLIAWPRILTLTLTPIVAIFAFCGLIYSLVKREYMDLLFIFSVLYIIFTIQCITGSMILNPRYTIMLGMFLIPYSVLGLERISNLFNRNKKLQKAVTIIFVLSLIISPLIISSASPYLSPLPTAPPDAKKISVWLKENVKTEEKVIFDHYQWNQPYIALYSGLNLDNIYMVPGGKHIESVNNCDLVLLYVSKKIYFNTTDISKYSDGVRYMFYSLNKTDIDKYLDGVSYMVYSPEGKLSKIFNFSVNTKVEKKYNHTFECVYQTGHYEVFRICNNASD
ncbi:MAG: glycosyltransferase family 39 protein [Methanophagales archaeon]|nr:glycosyltransferase family 39 protein [Methanophagales archaeon]